MPHGGTLKSVLSPCYPSTFIQQFGKTPAVGNYAQPVRTTLLCHRVTGWTRQSDAGLFQLPDLLRGTLYRIVSVIQHWVLTVLGNYFKQLFWELLNTLSAVEILRYINSWLTLLIIVCVCRRCFRTRRRSRYKRTIFVWMCRRSAAPSNYISVMVSAATSFGSTTTRLVMNHHEDRQMWILQQWKPCMCSETVESAHLVSWPSVVGVSLLCLQCLIV